MTVTPRSTSAAALAPIVPEAEGCCTLHPEKSKCRLGVQGTCNLGCSKPDGCTSSTGGVVINKSNSGWKRQACNPLLQPASGMTTTLKFQSGAAEVSQQLKK